MAHCDRSVSTRVPRGVGWAERYASPRNTTKQHDVDLRAAPTNLGTSLLLTVARALLTPRCLTSPPPTPASTPNGSRTRARSYALLRGCATVAPPLGLDRQSFRHHTLCSPFHPSSRAGKRSCRHNSPESQFAHLCQANEPEPGPAVYIKPCPAKRGPGGHVNPGKASPRPRSAPTSHLPVTIIRGRRLGVRRAASEAI